MAILQPTSQEKQKPQIDLAGPDGNAFVLLGYALNFGKQLAWSSEKIATVVKEMQSDDYNHLVAVFDHHYGDCVDLLLPEGMDIPKLETKLDESVPQTTPKSRRNPGF